MAFDLVSSEYGWSDEQIGNLPVARLRQIVATIQSRKFIKDRQDRINTSWSTRTIASYIAMGYWIEKDSPNPALEMARTLSIDEIEREALQFIEGNPPEPETKEPTNGSFERLMMTFGNSVQKE